MDNLYSYCGLVDAKIRASDIDLPVRENFFEYPNFKYNHRAANRDLLSQISNMDFQFLAIWTVKVVWENVFNFAKVS